MSPSLPFYESHIANNTFLRVFDCDYPDAEFTWHIDNEDRVIYTELNTNWKFQFDNELPINLIPHEKIFIARGRFHRIIKGTDHLHLFIIKHN